jgi:hypothetical protein
MKFDGSNWVNVGIVGFSAGRVECTNLAFSPSNEPFVGYRDDVNAGKATVMKFNGNNWVNVGNTGFSAGQEYWTSLAFSSSGQPYVAYKDSANYWKATIMKYDSIYYEITELQRARISVYPNPATDKITIETSGETQESYLAIVNIDGQEVLTRQITQPKTQIDISNLPSGVYFVRLLNEKTVEVGKIIKQ